jgi:hypothetical protein
MEGDGEERKREKNLSKLRGEKRLHRIQSDA